MAETAEANVLRYARGRRPFLQKKTTGVVVDEEKSRVNLTNEEDWWESKSARVQDWLRSNPLHLGMDDDGVQLVKSMMYRGNKTTDDAVRARCWAHICIELEHVPGNPIRPEEVKATHQRVSAAQTRPTTVESKQLDSPETNEDDSCDDGLAETGDNNEGDHASALERKLEEGAVEETKQRDVDALDALQHEQKVGKPAKRALRAPPGKLTRRNTIGGTRSVPTGRAKTLRKAATVFMSKPGSSLAGLEKQKKGMVQQAAGLGSIERQASPLTAGSAQQSLGGDSASRAGSIDSARDSLGSSSSRRSVESGGKAPESASGGGNFLEECRALMSAKQSGANLSSAGVPRPRSNAESKPTLRRKNSFKRRKPLGRRDVEKDSDKSGLLDACRLDLELSRQKELEERAVAEAEERQAEARKAQQALQREAAERAASVARDREQAELERQEREAAAGRRRYKFAPNSTAQRGKIEMQDYSAFQLDSFYRKRDRGSSKPGVSLLMGRREDDMTEQVVAVIFDRSKFEEEDASEWVNHNLHRFPMGKGAVKVTAPPGY